MALDNQPGKGNLKGDPKVVSDTQGEEITPDNPEVVKQFPVENTEEDRKEVEEGNKEEGEPLRGTLPAYQSDDVLLVEGKIKERYPTSTQSK